MTTRYDEITDSPAQVPLDIEIKIQRTQAERKAWDSLGRYKFLMFGYHAANWVKFNQLLPPGDRLGNPFADLVRSAKIPK